MNSSASRKRKYRQSLTCEKCGKNIDSYYAAMHVKKVHGDQPVNFTNFVDSDQPRLSEFFKNRQNAEYPQEQEPISESSATYTIVVVSPTADTLSELVVVSPTADTLFEPVIVLPSADILSEPVVLSPTADILTEPIIVSPTADTISESIVVSLSATTDVLPEPILLP